LPAVPPDYDPVFFEPPGVDSGVVVFTGLDAAALAPYLGQTVTAFEGGIFGGVVSDIAVLSGTPSAVTVTWISLDTDLDAVSEGFWTASGKLTGLHVIESIPEPAALGILGAAFVALWAWSTRVRRGVRHG